jgi:hypothetical protein
MALSIMIDLETMGTSPDCVVLTLGAVKFDEDTRAEPVDQIYHRLDIESQTSLGRTIDDSTLDWWSQQNAEVRDEAFSDHGRVDVNTALDDLNRLVVGAKHIWAHGAVFDICILENLMRQLGRPCPWHYWQVADSRTLFGLCPQDPRPRHRETLHNALADAYHQAQTVQKVLSKIKGHLAWENPA